MSVTPAPVTGLRGVGPALAEKLERLGIRAISDLLFHLPLRYEDRTTVVRIGALQPGQRVVIEADVDLAETVYRGRRSLLVRVSDGSGALTLRFFYFSKAQASYFKRGTPVRAFGEVRRGPGGLEMVHPEYQTGAAARRGEQAQDATPALTPVYPVTDGVTQPRLRGLVEQALARLSDRPPPELLPSGVFTLAPSMTLAEALTLAHCPPVGTRFTGPDGEAPDFVRRLAFEELVAQRVSLQLVRETQRSERAPALAMHGSLVGRFLEGLSFRLTPAQTRVIDEIGTDLSGDTPALRLLQGDVGSGKTVVAAVLALMAVQSGYQAALMAPTELLADQHRRSLTAWLAPLGVEVGWLTGRLGASDRRAAQAAIASGAVQVVVGTHALFQKGVDFHSLALVLVDEQHRFGVHQRLALLDKGASESHVPHQVVMTATPIPRTLTMTQYGDLDVSIIDELPPGRTPVKTAVVSDTRRDELIDRVARACAEGQQVYWVCPIIEESEVLEAEAAEDTAARLTERLPNVAVGLIHGRQKSAMKEDTMAQFSAGDVQLLVATTVIEVGVDVPNASLMIIENAERMGLSQLHQLRGRVGRGAARSYCMLMYKSPLSMAARARLSAMRSSNDGFFIAERDLELRGPGEVLGTRQAGMARLRVADLMRDADLLEDAADVAAELVSTDRARADALVRRWVGDATRYVQA
ncbi:MAG: ATP-dependent DNA helicase RecG [Pseudomonadota bacterium]